jgi:hypothetical protein
MECEGKRMKGVIRQQGAAQGIAGWRPSNVGGQMRSNSSGVVALGDGHSSNRSWYRQKMARQPWQRKHEAKSKKEERHKGR